MSGETASAVERLNKTLEIAHIGSWELDVVNNYLTWSDEVYRIFGLIPQEFEATYEAFLEGVHPEDRVAVDEAYFGSLRDGLDTYEIEHRIIRKCNGEIRYVHEKCEHLRDEAGSIISSVGMVHDITERKEAEKAQQESDRRYRLLFANMLGGLAYCKMLFDEQGHPDDFIYLDVNASFSRITGLEGVVGKRVTEVIPGIKTVHPELIEAYGRVASTGQPEQLEIEFKPLGIWLMIAIYSPEKGHFVAVFDNITERKNVEDELRRANEELEKRVIERTHELRKKDYHLIQQNRFAAMGEMLNNIAHQWRQPLNSLGLIIQLLDLSHARGEFTSDLLSKSTRQAMSLVEHLSSTINDFSAFFKPDKEIIQYNVRKVVSDAIRLIEPTLQSEDIKVVLNCLDDPDISGFPNEYTQVLLNLLSNAKDAFHEHCVPDPLITITVSTDGNKTVVTVRDNAGGIPDDVIHKIFDPHFTTKESQGTGIGLFMAKSIVERHMHGNLSVVNTGDGAEFRIEI